MMAIDELDQSRREIFLSLAEFNVFPIDEGHLRVEKEGGETRLVFRFEARSDAEFSVEIIFYKDTYVIYCDEWHDEFELKFDEQGKVTDLIGRIVTLFNGKTKLITKYAGNGPYRWELMYNYERDEWESLGETGLLFYNYFGKRRVKERANGIIISDARNEEKAPLG